MTQDQQEVAKIAVITPFHKTPQAWLNRCLASVARQTLPCCHFLVCDGDEAPLDLPAQLQIIRLPHAHKDVGNAARAIGSVSAICQGFDAIAYLDSDNWYEPEHIRCLWEAHQQSQAAVLSTNRWLFDLNGDSLGRCPEVDGENFVDTNCMFLARPAFGMVAAWYLMPRSRVATGDRWVWKAIKEAKLPRMHLPVLTVNYRTSYEAHYRYFGKEPPRGAKRPEASVCKSQRQQNIVVSAPRPRVSLNMIVRNEEAHLEKCLHSVRDLVDEIVVVDTGSTDKTKQFAIRHGACVYDFPWVDDFAAARNECLRHSTGNWILWLDADESLDQFNQQRLRKLIRIPEDPKRVYMMKQWSASDDDTGSALVVDQARLFPKLPGVSWRHRIHEQILMSLRESGVKPVWTDIQISHRGYQTSEQRKGKLQRNLRLLELEQQEQPNNAFTLFNLAGTLFDLGELVRAKAHVRRCLEISPAKATFLPKAYLLLAKIHQKQGDTELSLRVCREGRQRFPNEVELLFEEGLQCQVRKDLATAQQCFERIVQSKPRPSYVGTDKAVQEHLSRHHLALVYRDLGRFAEAERQWQAAVRCCPSFGPSWLSWAELQIKRRRFGDLETLFRMLQDKPNGRVISMALDARLAAARSEWKLTNRLLTEAIAMAPHLRWLRLLLIELTSMQNRSIDNSSRSTIRPELCLSPTDGIPSSSSLVKP